MAETVKTFIEIPDHLRLKASGDVAQVAAKLIEMPDSMRSSESTYVSPDQTVANINAQLAERDPNAGPPKVSVGYIPRIV